MMHFIYASVSVFRSLSRFVLYCLQFHSNIVKRKKKVCELFNVKIF